MWEMLRRMKARKRFEEISSAGGGERHSGITEDDRIERGCRDKEDQPGHDHACDLTQSRVREGPLDEGRGDRSALRHFHPWDHSDNDRAHQEVEGSYDDNREAVG